MANPKPLESILDKVDDLPKGQKTNLKTVISAFGDRAFGPVLTLCGLLLLTPVGAIPGAPLALCVIIISFALQIIFGRSQPWLPKFLRKIEVRQSDIDTTKKYVEPVLETLDGIVRPRYKWAATETSRYFAAVLSILLALTLLPLGPIPFGATLPGVIIAVIGMGIMARDGLALMVGFGLAGLSAAAVIYLFF
ncbi:exopolysaccharide biosynthesis protein [Fretibacter rubidus]|uniref:exopolysaccharide biosynthesis protein n=1 Tax=Fretibacter rubidus TaxID=570162 RepID=UPI00352B9A05